MLGFSKLRPVNAVTVKTNLQFFIELVLQIYSFLFLLTAFINRLPKNNGGSSFFSKLNWNEWREIRTKIYSTYILALVATHRIKYCHNSTAPVPPLGVEKCKQLRTINVVYFLLKYRQQWVSRASPTFIVFHITSK